MKPTPKDWQARDAARLEEVAREWALRFNANNPVPGRTYTNGQPVTYPEGYPVTHYDAPKPLATGYEKLGI